MVKREYITKSSVAVSDPKTLMALVLVDLP